MSEGNSDSNTESRPSLSWWQIIGSVCSSFYGVQSSKNRERDFQSGKAIHFIGAAIVMTAVWYLSIYLVVTIVLDRAG